MILSQWGWATAHTHAQRWFLSHPRVLLHAAGETIRQESRAIIFDSSRDCILGKGEYSRSSTCVFGCHWPYGVTDSRNVCTCLVCSLDNEEVTKGTSSSCARSHSWLAAGPVNPCSLTTAWQSQNCLENQLPCPFLSSDFFALHSHWETLGEGVVCGFCRQSD